MGVEVVGLEGVAFLTLLLFRVGVAGGSKGGRGAISPRLAFFVLLACLTFASPSSLGRFPGVNVVASCVAVLRFLASVVLALSRSTAPTFGDSVTSVVGAGADDAVTSSGGYRAGILCGRSP